MKKFPTMKVITGAIIGTAMFTGGMYLKKQYFDDGSMLTTPSHSATAVWRLNAAGSDMRVYEFPLQSAPNLLCVFVAGTNKGSTFCFPKGSR